MPSRLKKHISKLFDEKLLQATWGIEFSHEILQEYFAACYITEDMNVDDFKGFAKTLFTLEWKMVRRFVSGLLAVKNSDQGMDVVPLINL